MLMMNPRRHKRMSAGAMVAVLIGVGVALVAERADRSEQTTTGAARALADTLDAAATSPADSGLPFIALAIGLLALVLGVVTLVRAQNTRH